MSRERARRIDPQASRRRSRGPAATAGVACLVIAIRGTAPAAAVDVPLVFTQLPAGTPAETSPADSGGMLRARYGEGGRLVRLDPDGRLEVLSAGLESACGADVSFDGERVLFAARRAAGESWGIFEVPSRGGEPRQVVADFGNCSSPAYQSTLYTLISKEPWSQIMFLSDAGGTLNEFGCGVTSNLYSAKLDGSALRKLTLNLSDDMDPFLDVDGRTIVASWQRGTLSRGFRGRVALFGVNIDGQDWAIHTEGRGRRVQHMPCITAAGDTVFVEADRVGWDGAGQLGFVSGRRPLHSYRPVPADPAWLYHSPAPLPDGSVVASRRPAHGPGTHGLCRIDPATGAAEPIHSTPGVHEIHARAVAPRRQPDGRSTVVDETKYSTGKLYCLDVNLGDPAVQPHLQRGEAKRLRVLQGVPQRTRNRPAPLPESFRRGIAGPGSSAVGVPPLAQKRFLGEVAIEPDGSFQVEVPADLPIQLQTVDEDGLALQTCSWIWVKHRGTQGCIGCHEDPELAPENRVPKAVEKPGIRLLLPPSRRRTVDFRRDVQPIIAAKCAIPDCHGGGSAKTDLRLTDEPAGPFIRSYAALMAPSKACSPEDGPVFGKYVEPGRARTSPLVWRLLGRNASRPWDRTHGAAFQTEGPHPPPPHELDADERLTFIEWIDLGALFDGTPPVESDRPLEIKEWESQ